MNTAILIEGIGAYGPGFSSWPELQQLLAQGQNPLSLSANQAPSPALISSAERRRAPHAVKFSIEVASQAVQASGRAVTDLRSVFASAMGDVGITNYMCTALNKEPKVISPTNFHNSVHNAPAGYWSIAANCHAPSSSVSAFVDSFGIALLEAWTQAVYARCPMLCVVADMAVPPPMDVICKTPAAGAFALVLAPADLARPDHLPAGRISLGMHTLENTHTPDPSLNPMAPALEFLAMLGGKRDGSVMLPVGRKLGLLAQRL